MARRFRVRHAGWFTWRKRKERRREAAKGKKRERERESIDRQGSSDPGDGSKAFLLARPDL